jgi:hypothetical protein
LFDLNRHAFLPQACLDWQNGQQGAKRLGGAAVAWLAKRTAANAVVKSVYDRLFDGLTKKILFNFLICNESNTYGTLAYFIN